MTPVVLDANALLMPFQFDINIDSELDRLIGDQEVYVPSSVLDELFEIGNEEALDLAKKYKEVSVEDKGDRGVIEAVEKLDSFLVTNDKELKDKVREKGYPVVYLRSKSHLEIDGEPF